MFYANENQFFRNAINAVSPGGYVRRDFLTEVNARVLFKPFLKEVLQQAKRDNQAFSVVFMDLDRFKKFNDKCGHVFGDEILKYIGSSLRLTFQDVPCQIFRYGGDEFVVVFPDKSPREAKRMIQLLKYNMARRPVLFKGKFYKMTASYGIAGYPQDGETIDDLVKKADMAQYASKSQGRNLITLANQIRSRKLYRQLLYATVTGIWMLLLVQTWPDLVRQTQFAIAYLTPRIVKQEMDSVVLKDGVVISGKIIHETHHSLTMEYDVKGHNLSLYLDKEIIRERIYGSKTGAKERFENYVRNYPNPHKDYE